MKKLFSVLFCAVLLSILVSCKSGASYNEAKLTRGYSNAMFGKTVVIDITDEEITENSSEINMRFTNNGTEDYVFGEAPHLEVLLGKYWYIVPVKEGATWIDSAYYLDAGQSLDYVFSVSDYYDLISGYKYRYVKNFYGCLSYAEFIVE